MTFEDGGLTKTEERLKEKMKELEQAVKRNNQVKVQKLTYEILEMVGYYDE